MGKNKLKRFEINAQRHNVIEPGKELFGKIKGQWRTYFKNDNPLVLELACGRGEYTTGLAAVYPNKNFVGVDIKGARIWKGSSVAEEKQLTNAAFLRTRMYALQDFFAPAEVDEIWLIHPDPRPRDRDEKHRLTFPSYMEIYKRILKPGGLFRFKTDNLGLFEYSLEVIQTRLPFEINDLVFTKDLYHSELLSEHHGIQTKYELSFLKEGIKINYLKCHF